MNKIILPEFQKFLLAKGLVKEKSVSYYAYWVSKFIEFTNTIEKQNSIGSVDSLTSEFLHSLGVGKKQEDWQLQQAGESVKLYIQNYLKGDISSLLLSKTKETKHTGLDHSIILERMKNAMTVNHYAYKTERSYLDWAKRFFAYVDKTNKKDGANAAVSQNDVRDYLTYLALNQKVAASTQNQAFNALLFLLRNVLAVETGELGQTVRAKRGPRLPVVLSVEEVQKMFDAMSGDNKLIAQLLYGAGLRLMELARLRVKDIDFENNLLFVRSGKGDKDRSTVLPESLKENLRAQLQKVKELHDKDIAAGHGEVYMPEGLDRKYPDAGKTLGWQYVFPAAKLSVDPRSAKIRRHHIGEKSIQMAVARAVQNAGIQKPATVHTLRHSFATHLLLNGTNIRQIQDLLGHQHLETTMIYTHVVRNMYYAPQSPLDVLHKKQEDARKQSLPEPMIVESGSSGNLRLLKNIQTVILSDAKDLAVPTKDKILRPIKLASE
jgi:integron integrase